jgi:hypothetical protein
MPVLSPRDVDSDECSLLSSVNSSLFDSPKPLSERNTFTPSPSATTTKLSFATPVESVWPAELCKLRLLADRSLHADWPVAADVRRMRTLRHSQSGITHCGRAHRRAAHRNLVRSVAEYGVNYCCGVTSVLAGSNVEMDDLMLARMLQDCLPTASFWHLIAQSAPFT